MNRQDACSTRKFIFCGTGKMPVLENVARCELHGRFSVPDFTDINSWAKGIDLVIGLELSKSFESNFPTGSFVHPTRKKNCGWAGEPVLAIFATSLLSHLPIALSTLKQSIALTSQIFNRTDPHLLQFSTQPERHTRRSSPAWG